MKIENTFLDVLNLDYSDLVIKKSMIRLGMNIRVIDLDSSTYAVTNIRGTEYGFTLTSGYVPLAAKQFDNVIYILSINPSTLVCELGSFGSPDYSGTTTYQERYRPLNNIVSSGVDDTNPGHWITTGSGVTWGVGSVTLFYPATNSNNLERAVSIFGGIPCTITYQAAVYNVGGGSATARFIYNFYNASGVQLYSKTFSYSGSSDMIINTTEVVTFSGTVAKVDIIVYKDTGAASPIVFNASFFNMVAATGTPFRTAIFGYTPSSFVKMELQPEYDSSINIILIERDNPPRIVNSKFMRDSLGNLVTTPDRPGTASSNTYLLSSLDEQTKLILATDKILKIALGSVTTGGKLKYGTFRYYFAYMTQDFNATEIIGQSGLCAVFTGVDLSTIKGGTSTQETDKKVLLTLSNIDTSFRYLKVYVLYSSGQQGLEQQMLSFVTPLEITGATMTFHHTGFEEVLEIDSSVVNTSFQNIDSATSATQVNGFLMLAGIREKSIDFTTFRAAALQVKAQDLAVSLPYSVSLSGIQGYADPTNVYNYVGLFGGEAYAYRVVFILPGGRLSPPFPIQGRDAASDNAGTALSNNQGIYRAPLSNLNTFFDGSHIIARGVTFNVATVPSDIKAASVGFFIVRAERNPNLITQGYFFPMLRVPPIEFMDSNNTYYNRFQAGQESLYKMVPCVDGFLEAFEYDTASGGGDLYVVDANNKLQYYFPIVINHFGASSADGQPSGDNLSTYVNNFPNDYWAFISADSLADEPEVISKIAQRQGMKCLQLGKVSFTVIGNVAPLPTTSLGGGIDHADTASIGLFYDANSIAMYNSPPPTVQTIDLCEFVPGESFATGSIFSSRIATRFKVSNSSGGTAFGVYLAYNSYFGMRVAGLRDISYASGNPQGGNSRIPSANFVSGMESSYFGYSNYLSNVNASFLVNVYPSSGVDSSGNLTSVSLLYPDIDSLIYKQVGQRYTWADAPTSVDIFDGDCYTVKAFRKLYQSGSRDPFSPLSIRNIDAGTLVSVIQQSPFNTNLRNPIRYDASEFQDRSFYPYQSKGDFNLYRRYRFPETQAYSPGYSPDLGPKAFVPVSSLAPAIRSDFFSRISVSAKHIPNAFQNGYRNFTANNFQDYDSSMGRIVDVLNHRGLLLVVFQHGIGLMPINERILVGSDASGPIYAKPSTVLPVTMGYPSRQIGCQNPLSIVQTPSAVYGLDLDKRKIWQFRDKVEVISDSQVSSFLENNDIFNPRSGYDFKYNEVVFTTDNWTLVFREGLEKFTSFYASKPTMYASRGGQFFGFALTGGSDPTILPGSSYPNFQLHDSPNNRTIYDRFENCFVEFTIPTVMGEDGKPTTNVYDIIEVFSSEVVPLKAEFFTYNNTSKRDLTLNPNSCGQYTHVDSADDFFKQESSITYRDKRFIIQIPNCEIYNGSLDNWAVGGRMRNKYLIVRLTYNTTNALQLMSIITTFRVSKS